MNEILEQKRVLPLVTIDNIDDTEPLAQALIEGGLPIMEVPFRTSIAAEAIQKVRDKFPEMLVGAGTVLSIEQLEQAADAGAQFAVAPGFNSDLVERARELDILFIPGVMTPTEIEAAIAQDCMLLKYFPAEVAGGVKFLKAIAGPYTTTGVKFIPTGGITSKNAEAYLRLTIVGAVGASWMTARDLVVERGWSEITRRTREICEAAARAFT